MQRSSFWSAVTGRDANENIFVAALRILGKNVEVPVFSKHSCVVELKLRFAATTLAIFLCQCLVRKLCLRILVEHLHIAVRGRGIQIEVILFHVLAVITLVSRQTKKPLFQDRVAAIPQS